MAYSEWPRGRWLVAYGDMHIVTKTLRDAQRAVDAMLQRQRAQTGLARTTVSKNAVIVKVGAPTAYHGRLHGGSRHGRIYWERVRPLGAK